MSADGCKRAVCSGLDGCAHRNCWRLFQVSGKWSLDMLRVADILQLCAHASFASALLHATRSGGAFSLCALLRCGVRDALRANLWLRCAVRVLMRLRAAPMTTDLERGVRGGQAVGKVVSCTVFLRHSHGIWLPGGGLCFHVRPSQQPVAAALST